tara:strand:+ start:603 stop:1031 length:429 start_codon:yes stop_codon:yes gene_type:complete
MKSKNGPFKMKKTPAKHTGMSTNVIGAAGSKVGGLGSKNYNLPFGPPLGMGGSRSKINDRQLGFLMRQQGISNKNLDNIRLVSRPGMIGTATGMFGGRNTDINQLNNYAVKAANTQRSRVKPKPKPKRRKRRGFLSRLRSFF